MEPTTCHFSMKLILTAQKKKFLRKNIRRSFFKLKKPSVTRMSEGLEKSGNIHTGFKSLSRENKD